MMQETSSQEKFSRSGSHSFFSSVEESNMVKSRAKYNGLRTCNFSLSLYRLISVLIYPGAVLFGHGILALAGQAALLASSPPLLLLICIATGSAIFNSVFLLVISSLIDRLLPNPSAKSSLAHGLVYFLSLMANVHFTAYVAALIGHRLMTVYSMYAILGAGIVPAVLCSIALILLERSCQLPFNLNSQQTEVVRDPIVITDSSLEDSKVDGFEESYLRSSPCGK